MDHPEASYADLEAQIAESPEAIQSELQRSANNWAASFGTRVFLLETTLARLQSRSGASDTVQLARLDDLKRRLQKLKDEYPRDEDVPPKRIRKDFLKRLDILAPDYPELLPGDPAE